MKRFFCAVLALMFLACAALADTSLITGEVVEIPTPGDVRLLISDQAFEASFNDRQMFGALQPDGTLLIGTQEKAVRLGGLPDESLLQGLFDRLDQQPTYQNSIYSSLFTQAQKIELPADEVRDYALTLISLFPLLDRDGSLRQALGDAAGSEPWASVTRYRADPSQYPKTWMMDVNVFSPALPALRVQYRQDEFGSNFEIACTRNTTSVLPNPRSAPWSTSEPISKTAFAATTATRMTAASFLIFISPFISCWASWPPRKRPHSAFHLRRVRHGGEGADIV